ncbi:hypothetical protein FO439_00150 [Weissella cibaria]|nr:hypothetical protein FO439_00150 [Weissella cibaria]
MVKKSEDLSIKIGRLKKKSKTSLPTLLTNEEFLTILGGMGTLATESYVRLLNKKTETHKDQDHLDYIVVNHY